MFIYMVYRSWLNNICLAVSVSSTLVTIYCVFDRCVATLPLQQLQSLLLSVDKLVLQGLAELQCPCEGKSSTIFPFE